MEVGSDNDNNNEEIKIDPNQSSEEFFKSLLYKQMLDTNSGNSVVMQTLIGKLGEKIMQDGDTNGAIKSISDLNDLTKTMQINTIEIMERLNKG